MINMAFRRSLNRVPIDIPMMVQERLSPTWLKWFANISDYIYRYDKYEILFNPTSVPANTTSEQTVTILNVASNDFVAVSKSTHTTGLGIVNVRVSAANTVAITFMNNTGSPIDPPEETYTFKVEKI